MKAKIFDQQFDKGVDITGSLDLSKSKRVLQEQKRVNVDFSYMDGRIIRSRSGKAWRNSAIHY